VRGSRRTLAKSFLSSETGTTNIYPNLYKHDLATITKIGGLSGIFIQLAYNGMASELLSLYTDEKARRLKKGNLYPK